MIINQKIYNQIDATTKTIKSEERMERNYESVVDKDYESFTKIIADHCCGYLVVACKTFRRIIQAKIILTDTNCEVLTNFLSNKQFLEEREK